MLVQVGSDHPGVFDKGLAHACKFNLEGFDVLFFTFAMRPDRMSVSVPDNFVQSTPLSLPIQLLPARLGRFAVRFRSSSLCWLAVLRK